MIIASVCGVAGLLLMVVCATNILLPVGTIFYGVFYAAVGVLMPILAGAVFGTGESYSKLYGRTLLPTKIICCPAAVLWPLIAENFGGYTASFVVASAFIAIFGICSVMAIKAGKKLPRVEPNEGGQAA